jgi:tetratricopeptide (TPR) repeat protein
VSPPGRPKGEQEPERASAQGSLTTPLVSVVVRSMARPTLPAALDSIAAQDYGNVEIVLVAASGPSHAVPDARYGRVPVRFVASEVRLLRPLAANAGIETARGDYVTFLDDDDTIVPNHLSGLVAALAQAGDARVVHSVARAVFLDGQSQAVGRPMALMTLFERNFIHLSASLIARSLVEEGARFDPQFAFLDDWDFFIGLAQRARFHFVPQQTFVWNAEVGDSGAGGGRNIDETRFAHDRDLVYAKWQAVRDALVDRVQPMLQAAAAATQRGDMARAEATCHEVLGFSQNDPWALNLLAMIERATGRLAQARATQELAVAVRPGDPDLVYNLALLCREGKDTEAARKYAAHAVSLAPGVSKYRALAGALG